MRLRIKDTSLTLRIIGWQQVVGGIAGLGLMAYLMLHTGTVNGTMLLIIITGLALFSYSIYTGKRLLTEPDKRAGVILSIINQAAQLVQWSMYGFGLSYSSGAEITVGVVDQAFNFNIAALVSTFRMSINTDPEFLLKVNLIAFLIMLVLVDIHEELKNHVESRIEESVPPPELNGE